MLFPLPKPPSFESEEEFNENQIELNNNESSKKEVQLNTIHSTKGKEWKLVVIFDANEKNIQGRSSKKTDAELEEELDATTEAKPPLEE